MENQKVRKTKCIICKKEFNSLQKTIKDGKLKGCEVVNCYCSQKCKDVFEKNCQEAKNGRL